MKLTREDIKKYGTKKELKEIFEDNKLTTDDAVAQVNGAMMGWLSPEERKNFTEDYLLTLKEELEKFIKRVNEELEFLYDRSIRENRKIKFRA
jgi:uncharacterized FlaG/YvyC family protein